MKKLNYTIKKGAMIILALLVFPAFIMGGKDKTKPTVNAVCLKISGLVKTRSGNSAGNIVVKLIEENTAIDSICVHENEAFSFSLKRDKQYAIKIFVPGIESKLICISTYLPSNLANGLVSKFHFELYPYPIADSVDDDLPDFPVALICYDTTKKYFDYNSKYTDFIKKAYKSVSKQQVTKL